MRRAGQRRAPPAEGALAQMSTWCIVNPVAGGRRTLSRWAQLRDRLRSLGIEFVERHTESPGHAAALAVEAVRDGASTVVAVGGDGTVHEAANGLLSEATATARLAILPTGTGNDFARSIGLPLRAADAVLALVDGRERRVDVGAAGARYFVNVAGVGFDAEVAREVASRKGVGRGPVPYIQGLLKMLARYRNTDVVFTADGVRHRERVLLLAVGNGPRYGGGMMICPGAEVDDGLLDVLVAGDVGKLETLALLPRVFTGRHLANPKVSIFRCRELIVEASERPLTVHADGEIVGTVPMTFRVFPRRLTVWVPRERSG